MLLTRHDGVWQHFILTVPDRETDRSQLWRALTRVVSSVELDVARLSTKRPTHAILRGRFK